MLCRACKLKKPQGAGGGERVGVNIFVKRCLLKHLLYRTRVLSVIVMVICLFFISDDLILKLSFMFIGILLCIYLFLFLCIVTHQNTKANSLHVKTLVNNQILVCEPQMYKNGIRPL